MKKSLSNFFKSRLTQASLLLALIATAATLAGSNQDEGSAKLGGTWVGRMPGLTGDVTWISTYSPDSSGRSATTTLEWMTVGDFKPGLFPLVGADRSSIASGVIRMTGKDTAVAEWIWYLVGPTQAKLTDEIKAIAVMSGELHFTGASTFEGTYHMKVYYPNDDRSMVPTDTSKLVIPEVTFENIPHRRVF